MNYEKVNKALEDRFGSGIFVHPDETGQWEFLLEFPDGTSEERIYEVAQFVQEIEGVDWLYDKMFTSDISFRD